MTELDKTLEPNNVFPLRFYCQAVLPAVYDDSLSYYEAVCKVGEKLNEVIEVLNQDGKNFTALQVAVNALKEEFEQFKASGFDDYYAQQVENWVNDNLTYVFDKVIKQVYFGLTLDGHFVAYIPSGWSDIMFDTGMNYSLDTYGRLILRWNTSGKSQVDQSRETIR